MPVIQCPHCRKAITAPAGTEGRQAACPHCRKAFLISGKPALPQPKSTSAPIRETPTPRSHPKKQPRKPRLFWFVAGGGLVGVLLIATLVGRSFTSAPSPPSKIVAWEPEKKFFPPVDPPKKSDPPKTTEPPKVEPKPELPKEDPSPPPLAVDEHTATVVARLNIVRNAAGLAPVTLDVELSKGCQAHADYVTVNRPKLSTGAAGVQDENPDFPGFSAAGRKAARGSLMAYADPATALDLWMGRINSRPPLLHPDLEAIGVGVARSPKGEWFSVVNVTHGHGAQALAYPAPGQKNVPLSFSGGPEADRGAGFPVSLQFPPSVKLGNVDAYLADELGNRIPIHLSTPDQPLPGVKRGALIGMIPTKPLAPKSVYQAHVKADINERRFKKEWQFTTEDDSDADGGQAAKMLDKINRIRRQAELLPVTLDDELSRACRLHAKYLVINATRNETQGLGAHQEDPKLPGYTEEGHKAGKASDIALGDYEPEHALDGWMATLYHRIPILEPDLRKVGFGCARGARLGWITVLDIATGRDKGPRSQAFFWPVEGQIDVPLNFPPGGETPNPIPQDKTGRAGYPITATFPTLIPLKKAQGRLVDAKGRDVPCWFSSPESPANPQFVAHQGKTVCLIPKEPLRPEETYRVTITGEQRDAPWKKSWTFTTAKAGPDVSDAVHQVVQRINRARQSAGAANVVLDVDDAKGCQSHADYLVRNGPRRDTKGFSVNDEDPSLPGFTPEGQQAARRADVFSLAPAPTTQIDDLLGTLYRRSFVLDPRLRRVGVGCALEVGSGWINVLDLNSGRADSDPIVYPGFGQEHVPIQGHDRIPGQQTPAGFPITVLFPGRPKLANVRAALADSTGATIDIWLSTPDAPFDADRPQPNVIAIHPRRPLRPGRIYSLTVSGDVNGSEWRLNGRFSTAAE